MNTEQRLASLEQTVAEIKEIVLDIHEKNNVRREIDLCPYLSKAQAMWRKDDTDIRQNVQEAIATVASLVSEDVKEELRRLEEQRQAKSVSWSQALAAIRPTCPVAD